MTRTFAQRFLRTQTIAMDNTHRRVSVMMLMQTVYLYNVTAPGQVVVLLSHGVGSGHSNAVARSELIVVSIIRTRSVLDA